MKCCGLEFTGLINSLLHKNEANVKEYFSVRFPNYKINAIFNPKKWFPLRNNNYKQKKRHFRVHLCAQVWCLIKTKGIVFDHFQDFPIAMRPSEGIKAFKMHWAKNYLIAFLFVWLFQCKICCCCRSVVLFGVDSANLLHK